MGFITAIQKIFDNKKEEFNPYYEIRKDSFFLNPQHQEYYLKHGWCKIKDVIKKEEIDSFMETFIEISKMEGFKLEKHFLNSGKLLNPEIRKKTLDVINRNAKTILPRLFDMTKIDTHTGGAYQIKPPGINSILEIHQDSAVIDEEKEYSLFVWIPFCNVTMENGVVSFLGGSHLWGNTQRSPSMPWQFCHHSSLLYKYLTPVPVDYGDVIVFDPACIHASALNLSNQIRNAVTITVLKKDYQLVYYYKNPNIDSSLIEKYYVKENFYYDYDFLSKPDESKWRKEIVPYKPFNLSKKEMIKLIKRYLPKD
jgi:hypothetical protein